MATHKKKPESKLTMKQVLELRKMKAEIKELKKEVSFIKKNIVDPDTILTPAEKRQVRQAMKELKEGKTTSLSELKKELGWHDA